MKLKHVLTSMLILSPFIFFFVQSNPDPNFLIKKLIHEVESMNFLAAYSSADQLYQSDASITNFVFPVFLGLSYLFRDNHKEAVTQLKEAIKEGRSRNLDKEVLSLLYSVTGWTYRFSGENKKAITFAEKGVDVHSSDISKMMLERLKKSIETKDGVKSVHDMPEWNQINPMIKTAIDFMRTVDLSKIRGAFQSTIASLGQLWLSSLFQPPRDEL